ncbi:hypothetical protein ABZV58_28920 [Nocardia sp. NPDC004654]|uniref:hypothetical protein n=1 Tax=Nocardia sp. NPDC004654 TaxID=3154776 RepID=UPI0033A878CA
MTQVDFTVTDIFDIPGRGGLLVAGRLRSGEIATGDVLYDSASGASIHVIGVEFRGGRNPDEFTLVVDRRDTAHISIGQRIVTSTDPADHTEESR